MSINTLLNDVDSRSKPWANVYVDTLTAYKGLTVDGTLNITDLEVHDLDVTGDLKFRGNSGNPGQIIVKNNDGQQWEDMPPAQINPGPPGQFLRTNALGTGTEWSNVETSNIQPGIAGQVLTTGQFNTVQWRSITLDDIPEGAPKQFLKTKADDSGIEWQDFTPDSIPPGLPGQVVTTSPDGSSVMWADPSGITPGSPNQLLSTNSSGGTAWTTTIFPTNVTVSTDLNIAGNLRINGSAGTVGQFMKKTGSAVQAWVNIGTSDLPYGTNNQVLTTNSAGTGATWSSSLTITGVSTTTANIIGNLQLGSVSGSAGQYIRKASGSTQAWSALQASDITSGTANQILVTNPAGNGTTWSSAITVNSVQFPGGFVLDTYRNETFNVDWVYNSISVGTIERAYVKVGRMVTLTLQGIQINSGAAAHFTMSPIAAQYRPIRTVFQPCWVKSGGADVIGCIEIDSAGQLDVYAGPVGTNFSAGDIGIYDITMSWYSAT